MYCCLDNSDDLGGHGQGIRRGWGWKMGEGAFVYGPAFCVITCCSIEWKTIQILNANCIGNQPCFQHGIEPAKKYYFNNKKLQMYRTDIDECCIC